MVAWRVHTTDTAGGLYNFCSDEAVFFFFLLVYAEPAQHEKIPHSPHEMTFFHGWAQFHRNCLSNTMGNVTSRQFLTNKEVAFRVSQSHTHTHTNNVEAIASGRCRCRQTHVRFECFLLQKSDDSNNDEKIILRLNSIRQWQKYTWISGQFKIQTSSSSYSSFFCRFPSQYRDTVETASPCELKKQTKFLE